MNVTQASSFKRCKLDRQSARSIIEKNIKKRNEKKLFEAIDQGDIGKMEALLNDGVNVNALNFRGNTPLGRAASKNLVNCVDMIKSLISRKANLDHLSYENSTPLIYAADSANKGAVETLLEHKANPNIIDDYGDSALLTWNDRNCSSLSIKWALLEAGANPDQKNEDGNDLLKLLIFDSNFIQNGEINLEMQRLIDKLLETVSINQLYRLENPSRIRTLLMLCAELGDITRVEFCLQRNADPFITVANLERLNTNQAAIGRLRDPGLLERLQEFVLQSGDSESSTLQRVMLRIEEQEQSLNEQLEDIEANTSALSCARYSKIDIAIQQKITGLIFRHMMTLDANNNYIKAINRFKNAGQVCPITHEPTQNAVLVLETAQIYSQDGISQWFQAGNRKCPLTGLALDSLTTVPLNWLETLCE